MSYIPLNNNNFSVGDSVICIENRFAKTFDYSTGFRTFSDEMLPFLSLKENYKIIEKDTRRRKVKVLSDDGNIRSIPYYRLGVKEF